MSSATPPTRSTEAVYRALLESATDLMVGIVDGDLNLQFVNGAVRATLGWTPEELMGKLSLDFVHPDDRALCASTLTEVATSAEPAAPTLLRVLHRDGSWISLEIVAHSRLDDPAIQGVLVHARDVTERIRGAARLQQSELRLREIFECVHDGLFLVDAVTSRVLEGNRALCAFLGYDRHELLGLEIRDLVTDGRVWERTSAASAGTSHALEGVAIRRKDGVLRFSDLSLTTLALPDCAPIVVAVVRDVTERRAAERMRELFFGVVAHELRSPVAVLKTSVGVLRSPHPVTDAQRAQLLAIHEEEIDRLARIVADGLDYSAIHAGRLTVSPQPTSLEPLLRGLVTRLSEHAGREVQLSIEPLTARVDPGRVEQIVTNLIDNSWRHGGRETRASLEVARDGAFARISVEDDGPGIPDDLREGLFDQYFVASDRPTRGMGVGLWLSKRFVEAMGGSIDAGRGEDGKGCRVSFTVPLAP